MRQVIFDPDYVGISWTFGFIQPMYIRCRHLHVVSGSFNPLHNGHRAIYDGISGIQEFSPKEDFRAFEISTKRVGKEDLTEVDLVSRVRQFSMYAPVIVTNQPLFRDKIPLLLKHAQEVHFHVGYDVFEKTLELCGSVEAFEELDAVFHVWSREIDGETKSLPENAPSNCVGRNHGITDVMPLASSAIRKESE